MNAFNTVLALMLFIFCYGCSSSEQADNTATHIVDEARTTASEYPWPPEVTSVAIDAINLSIRNLKLLKKARHRNFPRSPGPYNFPFTQNELVEVSITGFSYSVSRPKVYEIDFMPAGELGSGNRISVIIDVKKKKAIMVYMKPDA